MDIPISLSKVTGYTSVHFDKRIYFPILSQHLVLSNLFLAIR